MKQIFVKDIKEGEEVDEIFLVDSVHRRYTKNNKVYMRFTLADKTGRIEAVMWSEAMEKNPGCEKLKAGDFAAAAGQATANRYSNKTEMVLGKIKKIAFDGLNPADFLPGTECDIDTLKADLIDLIAQVEDKHIRRLLKKIFDDPEMKSALAKAPAAKNYHHAYIGGLLEHSVSVGKLAVLMCDHYQNLNKSLLIAGAVLHDLGKVREFDYESHIDYSTEGRLKGHIVIGHQIVSEAIDSIKGFPEDLKLHLEHLILSHQGEPEFGAAVKPKTKEAVVLSIIDNMDAKINGWMQIAKKYGEDVEWTEFQSMFQDYLYLGFAPRGPADEEQISKPQPAAASAEENEGTLF